MLALIAFAILRALPGFGRADAATTAAHYDSVSVATFAVGVNWLVSREIAFEPQMTIFLAVPEARPALSLAAVLGVTFPLDILAGIPLCHRLALQLTGAG